MRITNAPGLLAKLYFEPSTERGDKLYTMMVQPPRDPTGTSGHFSIAWPIDRIVDEHQECVGFVMPAADSTTSAPLLMVSHPEDRRRVAAGISWQYLLRTARNLASVVGALHASGYVVGDLNDRNVLVSNTALVTLVDCDSMQVRSLDRTRVYRCDVGTPEFTPPELQGVSFAAIDRTPAQDNFALAVLIFQLLLGGFHPFAGVWKGDGDAPSLPERIAKGLLPLAPNSELEQPPAAPRLTTLPPEVHRLLTQCFVEGGGTAPDRRPTPLEWHEVLSEVELHLSQCQRNPHHQFSSHLPECPWCSQVLRGVPDPFSTRSSRSQIRGVPFARRPKISLGRTLTLAVAGARRGGKTTTAINLAACLADAGYKTLVIDLNPGCDATTNLGVDAHHVNSSLYEMLVQGVPVTEVIKAEIRPNLSLLPATVDLYAADVELIYMEQREFRLKDALEPIKPSFEFILIDGPCYEGGLWYPIAFTAADGVILTLPSQYSAFSGLQPALYTIRLVRDRLNPTIALFGVLMTLYDPRTKISNEVLREIKGNFPSELFQTVIPRNVRLAEAPSFGQTILEQDPRSPGALAYRQLADEVIARAASMG